MATVCACEDSYHRQVQGAGGRGDNVNNMHLRVPLPLPLALSMFLFEFLSLECHLPLASTPFLSFHPSLSVCACFSLSRKYSRKSSTCPEAPYGGSRPPSAWTRLVAQVWEIYSILNFVATLAKEQKYPLTYLCQTHWGQNFRDSRQTSKSVWVTAGQVPSRGFHLCLRLFKCKKYTIWPITHKNNLPTKHSSK